MFITFEGPDGSGKTTQIGLLVEYLASQGITALHLREPGGTVISEKVRDVLHDRAHQEMHPHTEVLLYSAARAQIVAQAIRPALEAGQLVICDRFYDSTFAYQGYGHGLDQVALREITTFATGGLKPGLTVFIDIDPEEGLRRRSADRAAEWNRLDALAMEFHRRVHQGYQILISEEPHRWVTIDGNRPIDEVQQDVQRAVLKRLDR